MGHCSGLKRNCLRQNLCSALENISGIFFSAIIHLVLVVKQLSMENNQHSNRERNTSTSETDAPFSNEQPGQQLPERNRDRLDDPTTAGKEEHSESSMPEEEDETLGTP